MTEQKCNSIPLYIFVYCSSHRLALERPPPDVVGSERLLGCMKPAEAAVLQTRIGEIRHHHFAQHLPNQNALRVRCALGTAPHLRIQCGFNRCNHLCMLTQPLIEDSGIRMHSLSKCHALVPFCTAYGNLTSTGNVARAASQSTSLRPLLHDPLNSVLNSQSTCSPACT